MGPTPDMDEQQLRRTRARSIDTRNHQTLKTAERERRCLMAYPHNERKDGIKPEVW